MNGGIISNCNIVEGEIDIEGVIGVEGGSGGGVCVIDSGSFTMNGGTIRENKAYWYGGGVYVEGGSFEIIAGTINGNSADSGGGVYVGDKGILKMKGGIISVNNAYWYGGGVFVGENGSFTMEDGTISGNAANSGGGGVNVDYGSFEMKGGIISGNKTNWYGGGVYVYEGNFEMESGQLYANAATIAGDDLYSDDENSKITLIEVSTMPDAVKLGLNKWYQDTDAARYKAAANPTSVTAPSSSTGSLALAAGGLYTVTYDVNGSTDTVPADSSIYKAGTRVTVVSADLIRTGYRFDGWSTAADGSGTTYKAGSTFTITSNTTLYAKWSRLSGGDDGPFTVYFITNGGTAISSVTAGTNSTVFLSDYTTTRSGYTFAGWYADAALTKPISSVLIGSNTTVYAKWTADSSSSTSGSGSTDTATEPDSKDTDINDNGNTTTSSPYIGGYEDGAFRPDGKVTRAEVAQMLYNIIGADDSGQGSIFSDVSNNNWYYAPVTYLTDTGIISGYEDGSYKPDNNITRAEFVTLVVKYAWLSDGGASFSDVSESHWAYQYIAAAKQAGYIGGYEDGTFHPDGALTRAEAVTILNAMLGRKADEQTHANLNMPFSDVPRNHWAYYQILEASVAHE